MIINLKVILREFLGLIEIARAQVLYFYKLTEVIIISKNEKFIFAIVKIILLNLEGLNNGQEFLIVDFVPYF